MIKEMPISNSSKKLLPTQGKFEEDFEKTGTSFPAVKVPSHLKSLEFHCILPEDK